KLVFLLLAVVTFVTAQDALSDLINNEVWSLVEQNPHLLISECTQQCDDLFDMVNPEDEVRTDQICHQACNCKLTEGCEQGTND
ncbi:hypothetical protein, partial [Staphylococcus aureus]|uniref:hypothetical protein n=1 Tax=Staphylococcus aureus TaxID=1280 RepID=UPI0038B3921D